MIASNDCSTTCRRLKVGWQLLPRVSPAAPGWNNLLAPSKLEPSELDVQLEGGSGFGYSESAVLLHYYNGYAAVAALAGASFEIVANMTRPDPCAV